MHSLFSLFSILARFFRERRGTAATEFALVFPVMVMAYFGAVSSFEGFRARQAVTKASTTVVDLITRSQAMTEDRRDSLYEVADSLVGTKADMSPTVTFTSVSNPISDPDEDARVIDWSYSNDSQTLIEEEEDLAALALPEIPKGNSVIIARVYIEHTPRFKLGGIFSKQNMVQITYRRPRFVLRIPTEVGT